MRTKTLSKDLVKVGQKFELVDEYGSFTYRFNTDRSNKLHITRAGGSHVCYVTDVREDGVELTIYAMGKKFTSFMAYSETIYVRPSK